MTTILFLQAVSLLSLLATQSTFEVVAFVILFGAGSGAITQTRAALVAGVLPAHYGSINAVVAL